MAASLRRAALRFSRRVAHAGICCFSDPLERQVRLLAARPQPLVGLFAGALLLGAAVVGAASPGSVEPVPLVAAANSTRPALATTLAPKRETAAREQRPAPKFASVIPFIVPPAATTPAANRPPADPPEPPVAAPLPAVDEVPAAPAAPPAHLAAAKPVAARADELPREAAKAVPVVAVPAGRALIAANRLPLEADQCQAPGEPSDQFGTLVHWARNLNTAARQAKARHKLVFAIQVSGNFANEEFT